MKITEFKICYDVQISMAFLTELDATIAESIRHRWYIGCTATDTTH